MALDGLVSAETATQYQNAVNAVSNYYNTDAQAVWDIVDQYDLTPDGIMAAIPNPISGDAAGTSKWFVNQPTPTIATDGSIMSWNTNAVVPVSNASGYSQAVNSNAGGTKYNQVYQLACDTNMSGGTSGTKFGGGISLRDVLNTPVNSPTIMGTINAATLAVQVGASLGKWFDQTLYNLNPDFFDDIGWSTLNPETWGSITTDLSDSGLEGVAKKGFQQLLKIDPNTGKAQAYVDADAYAYAAKWLNEHGVFNPTSENESTYTPTGQETGSVSTVHQPVNTTVGTGAIAYGNNPPTGYKYAFSDAVHMATVNRSESIGVFFGLSRSQFQWGSYYGNTETAEVNPTQNPETSTTYNGTPFYIYRTGYGSEFANMPGIPNVVIDNFSLGMDAFRKIATIIIDGNTATIGGIDGINNQPNATSPNFGAASSPSEYKQKINEQYPDLWQNALYQDVVQPDGTIKPKVYLPVPTPTTSGVNNPQPTLDVRSGQSQQNPEVDPSTATEDLLKSLLDLMQNLKTATQTDPEADSDDEYRPPNPPDTGTGNTPTPIIPVGQASALWAVYNPTQAEINSFGAWLWSSSFVDQLLKLFNDPMQSIIGLHKIFAPPTISGTRTIVVGYLDSGVSSNAVGAQYTDVNCGSVNVSEVFGNVFDYNDTTIRLYLPFIGIVALDTSDVMRSTITIVYHVDVITGACLADVRVSRDGGGGVLYQFSGDCAVRYPVSSGSYMGIAAGVLSVVGGIASGIMSGGATLPIAAGAVMHGMSGAHTQVQHSGSFSGAAGAMGIKKPYLIIERPQTALANRFARYQGLGANTVQIVGDMSGYFKMTDVHLNSVTDAAESELSEIKTAFEQGVIA